MDKGAQGRPLQERLYKRLPGQAFPDQISLPGAPYNSSAEARAT